MSANATTMTTDVTQVPPGALVPAAPGKARVPKSSADWNLAGLHFKSKGDLEKAIVCYQKALKVGPEEAGIWSNAGNAMAELKKYPNAILAHRRALKLEPDNPAFKKNMVATLGLAGASLKREKQLKEALSCYREALKLAPKNAAIWSGIGNLLLEMGRESLPKDAEQKIDFKPFGPKHESWKLIEASVRSHRVAIKLEPRQPAFEKALAYALNTVGVALRTKKQYRAALTNCQEAVRLAPDIPSTWSNLGNVLKDLKYIQSAIACHKRAVALAPKSSDCLFNLAVAYSTGMKSAEALETLDKALVLKPNDPDLRWDRALNHLRLGNYVEGFRDYEARLETGALPNRNPPGKPWRGESYAGQTLLIVSEQGYGDTIWAARYLGRVKALGGELIVECRQAMVPLIQSMGVADRVIAKGSPFPAADWHINICSLPGLFVRTAEDISGAPYIKPPADRLEKARAAIGDARSKLKVGIVWSGSTTFKGNHDRAVPLRMFLDAFALPGVQLYSLQKGPPAAELKAVPNAPIIDLGPIMEDFADAAAIVSELDLIVMTDSAVAHLAGALGKPVFLLLNGSPYWIWTSKENDTTWYERVKVVRQKVWQSWVDVFDMVGSKLLQKLENI
jgi:tetratricopeptide (TPR) repeat protein